MSSTVLTVSISQLTKSDSGRYRCGLERPFLPDSYWEFDIRVTDGESLRRVRVVEEKCNVVQISSFINITRENEGGS